MTYLVKVTFSNQYFETETKASNSEKAYAKARNYAAQIVKNYGLPREDMRILIKRIGGEDVIEFDEIEVGMIFKFMSTMAMKTGRSSTYNAVDLSTGKIISIPLDFEIDKFYTAQYNEKKEF